MIDCELTKEEVGRSLDELDRGLQQGETNGTNDDSKLKGLQLSEEYGDGKNGRLVTNLTHLKSTGKKLPCLRPTLKRQGDA